MKKNYKIEVGCANCENKMEDAAKKDAHKDNCFSDTYDRAWTVAHRGLASLLSVFDTVSDYWL